jgi:hypothetical protein
MAVSVFTTSGSTSRISSIRSRASDKVQPRVRCDRRPGYSAAAPGPNGSRFGASGARQQRPPVRMCQAGIPKWNKRNLQPLVSARLRDRGWGQTAEEDQHAKTETMRLGLRSAVAGRTDSALGRGGSAPQRNTRGGSTSDDHTNETEQPVAPAAMPAATKSRQAIQNWARSTHTTSR